MTRGNLGEKIKKCAMLMIVSLCACQKEENPATKILLGEDGLLPEILELVHHNYAENVATDKIVAGAINGALNTLDEFSNYYTEKDYKVLTEFLEGQFGGIGAEIKMTKEGLEVIAPIEDGPAFKAGIQRGDVITIVDGAHIPKLTPIEILQKVHGEPGTSLTLTLMRHGIEIKDIKIKRELITDTPIKANLEGRIAYIRVSTFSSQTADHIKTTTENLTKQLKEKFGTAMTLQGVILDLRNNPGGTLEQAVLVTSLFLDKGAIVNVSGKSSDLNRTFYSQGPDLFKDIPVVVLINKGSASASEVLAGALRDHKRAILVGEKTYGKGSVQRIFDLGKKGAVKITTAHFTTPEGHLIQGKGLEPDILVEGDVRHVLSQEPLAAQSLGTLPAPKKMPSKDTKELESQVSPHQSSQIQDPQNIDHQKQRALDLLQGLSALNMW